MPEVLDPPAAPVAPVAPAAPAAPGAPAGQSFDESFPDDGLDTPPEVPAKPAGETKPPAGETTPPAGETKPPAGETKPPAGETKPPAGETKPPAAEGDFAPPQVAKPSELRTWALKMGARAKQAETEVQKLHTRLVQLEQQPPRQAENTTALAQELATAKKRLEQYESDVRLTKYERSQEYAEKYQKPYQDSVARAYREVNELLVFEPNPDDPDNPRERPATKADFDEVYSLPLGQATRLAKQKFGDAATVVLQHRQQIRQLAESAFQAVEDYKAKGAEHETHAKAAAAQQQEQADRLFHAVVKAHAGRTPDLFQDRNQDKDGNELLAKGRQFAQAVFGGNEGLTPQQVAIRDAMAFNRLAAYPRVLRDLKVAQAGLAEAQKTIEDLRGSGPGAPKPGASKVEAGETKPWEQAFDELPA